MIVSPSLNALVQTIAVKYFNYSFCVYFIWDNNKSIDYIKNLSTVNIYVSDGFLDDDLIFRNYGCQGFIINHSNATDLIVQLESKIRLHHERFNSRRYLVIPSQNQDKSFYETFYLTEMQYIVDLLIITPSDESNNTEFCDDEFNTTCWVDTDYLLFTHKYVGNNNHNATVLLDIWMSSNYSFIYDNNLYPDKISNQFGRTLRCATFTYEPYSIIESSPSIAKGSENSIAHEYAKKHNMTLEYIRDDENTWGIIYENWTGNGILGNLVVDNADMGYGALYTWAHEYGFLDLSKPAVRTGITCLVPAPRLAEGWLTPLFPLSLEVWLATVFIFLFLCVVAIILNIFGIKQQIAKNTFPANRNIDYEYSMISRKTIFGMIRIFLDQSLPPSNTNIAFKYLFFIFLFSLLLSSLYGSGLASVMTIPRYEGAIETVTDLAESNLRWGATSDAWIFSILDDLRPHYMRLVEKFIATTPERLTELSKTNNFAFSIERLPSGQFAIGDYVSENKVRNLRSLREDLYFEFCVFMLRKNSPLLNSLDNLLLILSQSGIIFYWEMRAAQKHMDMRVQNIVKYYIINKEDHGTTVKLTWVHVEGVFAILVLGHILATLCFIAELVSHKCTTKKIFKSQ